MKPTKAKDSSFNKRSNIDDLVPNNPRFDSKHQSSDDAIEAETSKHILYDSWQTQILY
jgi:hypothetical protein